MKDKITILVPTHLVPSAPSTRVIEATLLSLSQIRAIYDCRCIIGFSFSSKEQGRSVGYINNLMNIKSAFNTEVFPVIEGQQRANFLNIIKRVETPYFLFWEHDWDLIEIPPITKIVKAMDKYKFINTIYFNKRNNVCLKYPPCGDFILEPEPRVKEIPLLKTSKWSNNPNVTRTSKWNEWMPIVEKAPLDRSNPKKQVEPPLHFLYMNQIKVFGFERAHALWGMYSFGELSKNKMVEHQNGNKTKE